MLSRGLRSCDVLCLFKPGNVLKVLGQMSHACSNTTVSVLSSPFTLSVANKKKIEIIKVYYDFYKPI